MSSKSAPLLSIQNLGASIGTRTLFEGLQLSVHPGERWGVTGPNGAGKSTFFRMLTGELKPDGGTIAIRNGIRMAVVAQKCPWPDEVRVSDALHEALPSALRTKATRTALEKDLEVHAAKVSDNHSLAEDPQWLRKLTQIQDALDALSHRDEDKMVQAALVAGRLEALQDRPIGALSGGEQKRLQLIAALLGEPQLLLLDEPTNHLDVPTVDWLEEFLIRYAEEGSALFGLLDSTLKNSEPFAFLVISHDRALLDTLVTHMLEIDGGTGTTFEGNYETYSQLKLKMMEEQKSRRNKLSNLWKTELAWLRAGVKARTTKQTARIERAWDLAKSLKVLEGKTAPLESAALDFTATQTSEERDGTGQLMPVHHKHIAKILLELEGLSQAHPAYPDGKRLLTQNLDLTIGAGTRLALIGPNGCGKTTLLSVLTGLIQPTQGKRKAHELLSISWFDQHRTEATGHQSIREFLAAEGDFVNVPGHGRMHVASYLGRFQFELQEGNRPLSELSGGEQARLLLARTMLEGANVLILDEPTNDLDIPTLQILEASLQNFAGAIVLTSHDRYFLQRVATRFLVWAGEKWTKDGLRVAQWEYAADLDQALTILDKAAVASEQPPQKILPIVAHHATETAAKSDSTDNKKKKLSYSETFELEKLELRIAELDELMPKKSEALHEAWGRNAPRSEVQPLEAQLAAYQKEYDTALLRWEFLMEKKG